VDSKFVSIRIFFFLKFAAGSEALLSTPIGVGGQRCPSQGENSSFGNVLWKVAQL
jgi:hypothetical protein